VLITTDSILHALHRPFFDKVRQQLASRQQTRF
jgi:hypothetical protein